MGETYWEEPFPAHHHPEHHAQGKVSEGEKRTRTVAQDLSSFTQDLLARAHNGELDPLIAREREVERIIQILNRRTKRNPVLVGDPGVGKTAIVYGLAQKIAKRDVPPSLQEKRIYALNVSALVAGTMFRGDFEARLDMVLREIRGRQAILFIDEIHTLVGAGQAFGALDAANMLKPALAEGHIQVIGSTSFEEYKFFIESDKALERRFQPVFVNEPSPADAVEILKGLKGRYEDFHRVRITQEALEAAVKLSDRYIPDRFLPDKALDVLDEASVITAITRGSSRDVKKVEGLRMRALQIREKKDRELHQGMYDNAFSLKREEELLLKRASLIEKSMVKRSRPALVTERDVRRVVSSMTGIPLEEMSALEMRKLRGLEQELSREIIGQEEAIQALALAIRRSRAGLTFQNRPVGSFIFVGPSGVGKTELARVLARKMYGADSLIKFDMSEFMEAHTVARLIGAPAGYVGYGRGGELTEKVRRNPYSLLLFDEIEKAHPQLFNILLQILEDGVLSDAMGLEVDFKNTIIVLTSNLGTERLFQKKGEIGFSFHQERKIVGEQYEDIKREVLSALELSLRPEFLNRIDDVIVFKPLSFSEIQKIATLQLKQLRANLFTERQIQLTYPRMLTNWIAQKSFQQEHGARLVRRTIEKEITDTLAQQMFAGKFRRTNALRLKIKRDAVVLA